MNNTLKGKKEKVENKIRGKSVEEIILEEWLEGEKWSYYDYGYYFSNMGRVYSVRNKNGKFLNDRNYNRNSYVQIAIGDWTGKIKKTHVVHRIVAELFVYNPFPSRYNIVHHKNGNKQDNRASNLGWTDHDGNMKALSNDTLYFRMVVEIEDISYDNDIFTSMQGLSIIGHWSDIKSCSDEVGIDVEVIRDACKGIRNKTGRNFRFIS